MLHTPGIVLHSLDSECYLVRISETTPAEAVRCLPSSAPHGGSTLGDALKFLAELQPDQPAIVATGYSPFSYRELGRFIDKFHSLLRAGGLSQSARIAIALPNGPQAALAIVAVACSSIAVPLNPKQTAREIEQSLTALRPDAILLSEATALHVRRAAQRKGIMIINAVPAREGLLDFDPLVLQVHTALAVDRFEGPRPEDPAFILQTSGTAAAPKLIPFSHRNMLAAAARHKVWYKLTPQDRCLSLSPVFYSHGLKVTVFTPLLSGGSTAFPSDASRFDDTEWFTLLSPTWYSAGPMIHRLIFEKTRSRLDNSTHHRLRFITGGGAPLPQNILEGLEEFFQVRVAEHYGSSEAALVSSNQPTAGLVKAGTCGIPWPNTLMIVAEDGQKLPPGQQGEIIIRGETLIAGYLDAPELNKSCFVDGWFKTGDVGSLDEEGFLTVHGRKTDLINRGGEKISPAEIDSVLMRHPAVVEAAAFPVPHPRLGEEVAAAVVLRPDATISPGEIRGYLIERLAPFKIPKRILILQELPKGITGKVLRHRLTGAYPSLASPDVSNETSSPARDMESDGRLMAQITALWERMLNVTPLPLDADFFEYGGDSLLAVDMVAELERLTGRSIPDSILLEAGTIRQLVQMLSQDGELLPKPLIQLPSSGRQSHLFFFHGDFIGGGYYSGRLARAMSQDWRLTIVAPHGTGDEVIPPTIEAMAVDRVPFILQTQPDGSYRLCGYCIGGLVAFEVARKLIALGKEVEFVGMIDTPTINASPFVRLLLSTMLRAQPIAGPSWRRAMAWTWYRFARFQRFSNLAPPRRRSWAQNKLRSLLPWRGGERFGPSENGSVQRADPRTEEYALALSTYFPKALSVPVTYFAAEHDARPWRRISSDVDLIKFQGDHDEVVRDTAVLARNLMNSLDQARRKRRGN